MPGLFGNIKLKGMIGGGARGAVGIDIGSSAVKIVHLKAEKGKAVLLNYGSLALGPYANTAVGRATNLSRDKLAEAVKDLLREMKLEIGTRFAVSIPHNASLMMVVEMPAMDKRQAEQAIPLEARKYIPVPIGEVILDWSIIPAQGGNVPIPPPPQKEAGKSPAPAPAPSPAAEKKTMEVLLAAIHRETIRGQEELMQKLGWSRGLFEIETFSLIRAIAPRDIPSFLVVDIGAGMTKIAVVEYGVVRKSHIVNRGSQDVTLALAQALSLPIADAEEIKRSKGLTGKMGSRDLAPIGSLPISDVCTEANNILVAYEKRYQRKIGRVILTGGGAMMKGITDIVAKHFDAGVVVADPFGRMDAPAVLQTMLREVGPEFSVATGLALKALDES